MGERDEDRERAHLRVEKNGVRVGDTDWEKALLRVKGNGVRVGDTDWERAHLRVGVVWRRQTPTGRERTLEWKGMS